MLLGFIFGATSALGLFVACSNTTFESASDGGVDESGAAASADASAGGCPHGHGPTMVQIPNQPFCIDSTEVTNAQYASFVAAISDGYEPADAGTQCSWNTQYQPLSSCAAAVGGGVNQPITCVDWCDAYSYCAWAGKHLCGGTDAATGPLDTAESVIPTQSQWELACSAKGTRNYPYGETFDQTACNLPTTAGTLSDVGSFKNCVGGYPGIFDMAGNAAEWVDACEDGGNAGSMHDNCAELGDSYLNPHGDTNPGGCPVKNYYPRGSTEPDVGFRCCAN